MFWAAQLLKKVYGPEPHIQVQHCSDQIGLAYFVIIKDSVNTTHVSIFSNAQSLVDWTQSLKYKVGDKVRLSKSGATKAPHMAEAEGTITWVNKAKIFTVELVDRKRPKSLTMMFYADDLKPFSVN